MNPIFLVFAAMCSAIGFIIGDTKGALYGFVVACTISLFATLKG